MKQESRDLNIFHPQIGGWFAEKFGSPREIQLQAWPVGGVRVLYISPLKALNNDIRRNLLGPLAEIEALFIRAGLSFPPIRALTRSGDTPQSDRQRMLRHPPEILITTVATSSLELGIDIGDLDEVVLIQTPFSVSSGLHLSHPRQGFF